MTEFWGRKWIAWFTSEIAIQDVTYNLNGLSGITVKVENSTQPHHFT